MSVASLLAEANAAGIRLLLENDALQWEAETDPPPGLLARLRASKSDIIEHLRSLEAEHQAVDTVAAPAPTTPTETDSTEPRHRSPVPTDADGMPVFDTSDDHLLGDGIVASAIRNQRQATREAMERARMAVDPALADDEAEVWLRGEFDE
ncbi:MAG: hypothetical protein AAGA21_16385 [Pseudomonadota bacterium]